MNKTISAVIIEDEEEALNYLSSILEKHFNEIEIIGTSGSIKSAIKLLDENSPELVFMDIELIDGDSFAVLDAAKNHNFEVIFISAHNDYIEKAIGYYAFNFLTKPIDIDRFKKVINRYIELRNRLYTKQKYVLFKEFLSESRLLINTGNEHVSIETDEIIQCEADGNYTLFTTSKKEKYLASKSLKYYEGLLSEKGFFRANRSTLINIKHIQSIYKKESIVLSNKEKVIVSVRNKSKLSELIKQLA